eukprot:304631-Chlamydomonas_euryale.AAC.1
MAQVAMTLSQLGVDLRRQQRNCRPVVALPASLPNAYDCCHSSTGPWVWSIHTARPWCSSTAPHSSSTAIRRDVATRAPFSTCAASAWRPCTGVCEMVVRIRGRGWRGASGRVTGAEQRLPGTERRLPGSGQWRLEGISSFS